MADVFVFPSENEPWGLVVNEVMCSGLPVIASREIGAVPDLVHHGENGFIYDTGNVGELSRCLNEILEAPEKRRLMAKASGTIIADWNYESCVSGIRQALAALRPVLNPMVENLVA